MPKITSPEHIVRIKALVAEGKSTRDIAKELGVGKSSVARYAKSPVEAANIIPAPLIENSSMSINDNAARSFLSDIGIKAPETSLRNEIVPPTSPLKNNPKALRLAQSLLNDPVPGVRVEPRRIPERLPERIQEAISVVEPEAKPEKHTLITQIHINVENFAPLLKNIITDNPEAFKQSLYKKTDTELSMLLKVIERTRLVGNLTNQMKSMFWMGTSAIEIGTQMIGLKSQGLTEALRLQDEEIRMVLKELALEKADSFSSAQRPEIRLAFLVSTTLLSVDAMNRAREQRSSYRRGKTSESEPQAEPQVKFADL